MVDLLLELAARLDLLLQLFVQARGLLDVLHGIEVPALELVQLLGHRSLDRLELRPEAVDLPLLRLEVPLLRVEEPLLLLQPRVRVRGARGLRRLAGLVAKPLPERALLAREPPLERVVRLRRRRGRGRAHPGVQPLIAPAPEPGLEGVAPVRVGRLHLVGRRHRGHGPVRDQPRERVPDRPREALPDPGHPRDVLERGRLERLGRRVPALVQGARLRFPETGDPRVQFHGLVAAQLPHRGHRAAVRVVLRPADRALAGGVQLAAADAADMDLVRIPALAGHLSYTSENGGRLPTASALFRS